MYETLKVSAELVQLSSSGSVTRADTRGAVGSAARFYAQNCGVLTINIH